MVLPAVEIDDKNRGAEGRGTAQQAAPRYIR